ncbi:MAG: efflux RND transporter permease subunit [Planctomycetota bacterium]
MSLPGFSVRRPIFTTMVTLIVLVLGAVSLTRLRIDLLPEVELPTLTVRTAYEGASPEVMERLVTQIVEEVVATVPGVEEMTSITSEGNSSVRVTFALGTDLDLAAQDVQGRLDEEVSELPEDVVRPRVSKFDIASFPVVILGISSDLDPVELTELIDDQVRYRFARVPGVAQADLFGGYAREIRIELDPERIRALSLPLDEVLDAIRDANLDVPTGSVEQGRYDVSLRAPAEFSNLDEIRQTVIAVKQGAPVTLAQVAEVKDTYERLTRIVRVNGKKGLRIGIRKQADANTVEVSNNVLEEIDAVNRDFPQIQVVAVVNQGNFIERSISNVARSVLYGGGLAILVLLLLLRDLRSTAVIATSIPISIVATFALVYFGGFTINLMTLGGLALGVGMMVDNSIVVLENIFRRRAENQEVPHVAAVEGAGEVAQAIVASTLTTLVIFLPLVFVRGVSGILFQELAYVIVFSLVASLLVSLSVVPMLASKFFAETHGGGDATDGGYGRVVGAYQRLLRGALGQRAATVTLTVLALAASAVLLPLLGTEFLPPSDEGEVRVTGEMEVGTRLNLVDQQTKELEALIYDAVPERVSTVTSVGASGWRPDSMSEGEVTLTLVRASERARSNSEIAGELRKLLDGKVAGMKVKTRAPQGQFLLDRVLGGDEGLKVEIRGFDLEVLEALGRQVELAIEDVAGITDVTTSRKAGVPQQLFHIDRRKAADLGVTVRDAAKVLETSMAGSRVGEYRTGGNSYRILVQLADAQQTELDEILDLTLSTTRGQDVALRNVVSSTRGRGPILIERKDQQRIVTVSANVAGRDMGSVARDVQARLGEIPRPVGYDLTVSGTYEEQQESFRELSVSIVLALLLVYMVLACQYESLRDPVIVMASVPLAGIGVVLTLYFTGTTLNVQSFIGCIMLGGIVVNNAILLVDQASQLRQSGMLSKDAVAEAGRRRLRPILMTTSTTILGLLPLALGIGEGADAQAPLARAVVGGLVTSTVITLVLVPVLYTVFHPDRGEPSVG